jgi:hypothetical protein
MKQILLILFCGVILSMSVIAQSLASDKEDYLSWTANQAENIGKAMRVSGKTGGSFDFRGINTDRAINYKLRATLLTSEVIRATARLEQLRSRLTEEQTRKLVVEAEAAGDIIVMVEIDPNEGSGVIPLDWRVLLQPKGLKPGSSGAITGVKSPHLQNVKALSGVSRRDYNYDVFWVAFSLVDENNTVLIAENLTHLELLVGIYNKEGRVSWQIPESVRTKITSRLKTNLMEKK